MILGSILRISVTNSKSDIGETKSELARIVLSSRTERQDYAPRKIMFNPFL